MITIRTIILALVFTVGQNSALAAEKLPKSSNQSPSISITRSSGDFVSRQDKVFAFVKAEDEKSVSKVTYELRRQGDNKLVLSGDVDLGAEAKAKVFSHIAIEAEFLPLGSYYFLFFAYDDAQDSTSVSHPATYFFKVSEK